MIHTPDAFRLSIVDLIFMVTTVLFGTWKFAGKSTCGESSDGGTTPLGVDVVVVVSEGAGVDGIVVIVPLADGIADWNSSEIVPLG